MDRQDGLRHQFSGKRLAKAPAAPYLKDSTAVSNSRDTRKMTSQSSRFFDELAKVMKNAAGAAQGARREVDNLVRAQIERVLADIQIVQREEFDVVRDMASMARTENEALRARIAELESRLDQFGSKPSAPARKKPAAKSSTPKK